MQTLVPKDQAELGQGFEWLALVVHSILRGMGVLQMWEFVPHIVVSAKIMPGPTATVQVVHKKL